MTERRPDSHPVPGPPIEDFLTWTLARVGHGVEQILTDSIAEYGLTPRQFGVLALLNAYDNLTQSDLTRAVLGRMQSIGPLVASLMERGLITRRGSGGRGRRTAFDFRRVLVRWKKQSAHYLAFLHFACTPIAFRAAGLCG